MSKANEGTACRHPRSPVARTSVPGAALAGCALVAFMGVAGIARAQAQDYPPRPVIERLNATMAAVLGSPEMKEPLPGLGAAPLGDTPEGFASFMRRELVRMGEVVKASGAAAQ